MKFFLIIFGIFFFNGVAYPESLECHTLNSSIELKINKGYKIIIQDRSTCDFDYDFVKNIDGKNRVGVIVGPPPSDLGINAQNSVYIKKAERFNFVGNLPVGAEKTSDGKYKYIEQQGGGIYLTFYSIEKNGITILNESKVLLIDGQYCADSGAIKDIENTEQGRACDKKIKASFNHSVCIYISKNKTKIMPISNCSELKK